MLCRLAAPSEILQWWVNLVGCWQNANSELAWGVWRLVGKFPPGFAILFGARQLMARWAQLDEDSAKRK